MKERPREQPDRYHKDLLHVMVRDAHTLYVYWEISNRKRWLVSQHFQCDWHIMPKVLRVYDVTLVYFHGSNANSRFDLETTPEANNWYIRGAKANATYVVDFGTYTWGRQFVPLVRSNFAATPRDTEAAWGEPVVGIVPQAQMQDDPQCFSKQRIPPHFFENFTAYSNALHRGDYIDVESNQDQAAVQRIPLSGVSCPSTLYPSSR